MRQSVLLLVAAAACWPALPLHAQIPEELREAKFLAVDTAPPILKGPHWDRRRWTAEFTIDGPLRATRQPLPERVTQAAYDPHEKVLYALAWNEVLRLDPAADKPETITPTLINEPLGRPCGMTFDTKRKRLLVAGREQVFAYATDARKWSRLSDANQPWIAALGYSPTDDVVYGLMQEVTDPQGPALIQMNAHGALVRARALRHARLSAALGDIPEGTAQIVPLKEHVVAIVAPESYGSERRGLTMRMFVISLKDYSIVETWSE